MPLLDEQNAWKVNAASNCWGFLVAVFMGALAIYLMQAEQGDCSEHVHQLFLGVGITNLICAVFYLYLVGVSIKTKDDAERAKALGGIPSLCLCYGGLTLLTFLILGSIWIWGDESDECREKSALGVNAKIFMIIWYALFGFGCCIAYVCVPILVGTTAISTSLPGRSGGGYQSI